MMEIANTMLSSELQVFLNYVYEYKKACATWCYAR